MDSNCIVEFNNAIPDTLCDVIIENIGDISKPYSIPKNSPDWIKIELLLYKQLLTYINEYRTKILGYSHIQEYSVLYTQLSNKLITKDITIYLLNGPDGIEQPRMKSAHRNKVLAYILFLDDGVGSKLIFPTLNHTISSEKCKLVIFYENVAVPYKYLTEHPQYIIYGQIYY
jgi:hypothetical protein